jgi:hypothetical protein
MDNYIIVEVKIICLWSGIYSSCMVSYNSKKSGIDICRTILIRDSILNNGMMRKMKR